MGWKTGVEFAAPCHLKTSIKSVAGTLEMGMELQPPLILTKTDAVWTSVVGMRPASVGDCSPPPSPWTSLPLLLATASF